MFTTSETVEIPPIEPLDEPYGISFSGDNLSIPHFPHIPRETERDKAIDIAKIVLLC